MQRRYSDEKTVRLSVKRVNFGSKILDQTDRVGAKSPIFDLFFARGDSAVTPSEKRSINANRKSIMRFPMSPRWASYVRYL